MLNVLYHPAKKFKVMENNPERRVGMFVSSDPDETLMHTQPEGSTAQEQQGQLPLRFLFVGDLDPAAAGHEPATPKVWSVDKNSFAGVMANINPRIVLDVPNHVAESPKMLELNLQFDSLRDFEPAAVARQVPALNQLIEIRTLVNRVSKGDVALDHFENELQAIGVDAAWAADLAKTLSRPSASTPPPAAGSSGSPTLDRLLGMMGEGPAPKERAPKEEGGGLLDSLFDAVAGDTQSGAQVEKTAASGLMGNLDGVISTQLNAIFSAPAFQQLEAAWRSVKILVDRLDFREAILLEVVPAGRQNLAEVLYYQVLLPEHSEDNPKMPLSAVLIGETFGNTAEDFELLNELAETGASLQTPVIAGVNPSFFGSATAKKFSRLPVLWQLLEGPEYIEWHKLRDREEASFLTLAVPPFLLRPSYGESHPAKGVGFEEDGQSWGSGALAVAILMADSFVSTGWPTHLTGGGPRTITNLPIWKAGHGHTPLTALLSSDAQRDLSKAGFTVLGGSMNRDTIHIERAQTVRKPESHDDLMAATEAKLHIGLPSQLFVARSAHFLLMLQRLMDPVEDVESTRLTLEAVLNKFIAGSNQTASLDAVSVEYVDEAGLPEHELFAVRLRAPKHILSRPVSLVLGIQLPKASA